MKKHKKQQSADTVELPVNVTIEIHDAETGKLLRQEKRHNLITLVYRNLIRDIMNGTPATGTISHFAVGTSNTAPTANDTALGAEAFRDVVTKRTPDSGKLTIQYYLGSTSANGNTLQEAGLWNAGSGGTLAARVIFQPIIKTTSITATFTWDINVNAVAG
ncbi:MAG: hypothetical protein M0021_09795 [Clostridia bacterium]|nr:hypothetical protein [Clostridia bacterium]